MLRSIVLAGGIAVLGAFGAAAAPLSDTYDSFFVFGDSLSDNGNLFAATNGTFPPSPPYVNGRFSNGPVWNEEILKDFTTAGHVSGNFALGGATAVANGDQIPDLALQIGSFRASVPSTVLGSRPLASLWFGANDILDAIKGGLDAVEAARAAAEVVGAGVRVLAVLGVTDFAVWKLPDIGAVPRFSVFQPAAAATATKASEAFNTQLDLVVAGLRKDGLDVTKIDTFGLFKDVLANPGAFGFANTTTPCILLGGASCTGLLYFDDIHPTAAAHAVLAQTFVAAIPLPASGMLLAFGLGLLALRRRLA